MPTLDELLQNVTEDDELFGEDGPCPVRFEGDPASRVLVVTGDNASGKSFLCKFLDARARDTWERSVEFMRVGMGRRTAPGIERSFIFGGNEDRESTGRVSSNAIKGGLSTSRNRNNAHFLCFDEPDIGLSARLQAGLGAVLADFARDLPEHLSGLIVVTHAQPIVRALLEVSPRCARVGGGTATTAEWAASVEPPATAEEFLDLGRVATERMRAIQAIMNARKAEQAPRR